jgi:hypothetical protein
LALVFGLSVLPVSAGQGNKGNPGVIPPQASSHGQSYGEWAAAWWQWVLSVPADHNPALDLTGADAAQGQSGPVPTPCCHDAVAFGYRRVNVPPDGDFHPAVCTPPQAHKRGHSCPARCSLACMGGQECPRSMPVACPHTITPGSRFVVVSRWFKWDHYLTAPGVAWTRE